MSLGNAKDAQFSYEAALAIAESLVAKEPSNNLWKRDLMVSSAKFAECSGDPKRFYTKALEIARELAADGEKLPDGLITELEKRLT